MALKAVSNFLYGFQITALNRSLDFRAVSGDPIKMATLNIGYYSLTDLMKEIVRAMTSVDPLRIYIVSANRTFGTPTGTENRITISTNGAYLDLLFGTGPRFASSVGNLIGFPASDQTGATSYTGNSSAGTSLVSEYNGYNYLSPEMIRTVFGALNVSANGGKEAIVWNLQKFFEVTFKYEPEAKVITQWADMLSWAVQQKPFEFTPEITSPNLFYNCTLESTSGDGKGLGYKITEMLPDFPFNYQTGNMRFRLKEF